MWPIWTIIINYFINNETLLAWSLLYSTINKHSSSYNFGFSRSDKGVEGRKQELLKNVTNSSSY